MSDFQYKPLAILALFAAFGAAEAQDQAQDQAQGAPDRLVVTARQDEAPPLAVSPLEGPFDAFLSPLAPAELLNRAPGVFVQAGSGREHLTAIRSPVLTGGAGAGSFLFLQDGVPLRAAGFANVNGLFHAGLPFAEEVRILRGPGDVAYGSNALHGAVAFRLPEPGEAPSRLTLSAGSFDRYRAAGLLSGEGFTAGLSFLDDGGYREESGAVETKGMIAADLGGGVLRASYHDLDQETAGFVIGERAFAVDELRRSNPNPEAFRNVRHGLLSWERGFSAGGWEASVQPFARWTDMAFKLHFLPGDALEENEHASLGVLSIAQRPLGAKSDLTIGLDVDLTEGSLREFQAEPTVFSFVQGLHYDYRVKAQEAAPFAKLAHRPTDRLTLEAGLRGTFIRYDYDTDAAPGTRGRFRRPEDREDAFAVLTGRLAARYEDVAGRAWHASLARGARPPQTTELYRLQPNQRVDGIDPETMDSAELGVALPIGAGGLVRITGFAIEKRQVFFRDADGFNVTDGKTSHVGIEGDLDMPLGESFSLFASGTYAEHRYRFDRVVGNASETIDSGDPVDTAPKSLAHIALRWTPPGPWRGELSAQHVGRYAMNAANTVFYEGHDTLDLRIGREIGAGAELTGIIRNLTDERYAKRADFAFGNERYFPGEERAFELVLSARF